MAASSSSRNGLIRRLPLLALVAVVIQATICTAWSSNPIQSLTQLRHPSTTRTLPSPRVVNKVSKYYKGMPWTSSSAATTNPLLLRATGTSMSGQKNTRRKWWRSLLAVRRMRMVLLPLLAVTMMTILSPRAAMASTVEALAATEAPVAAATAAAASLAASSAPLLAESATTATAAATMTMVLSAPVPRGVELQLTLRLLFASLLGACVGRERSSTHRHSAGIRTMSLVALGACAFTIVSSFGFSHLGAAKCDPSRMASNVASGVGFVGAGVITTSANGSDSRQSIVHGLTTATAIWISAAIGVSCGVGLMYIATFTTLSVVTILRFGRLHNLGQKGATKAQAWWDHKRQLSKREEQHQPLVMEPLEQQQPQQLEELPLPPLQSQRTELEAAATMSSDTSARPTYRVLSGCEESAASMEEMDSEDDWDSHVECVDSFSEDEEAELLQAQNQNQEDTAAVGLDGIDRNVAEFHQVGRGSILDNAHSSASTSFGRNQTELLLGRVEQKYKEGAGASALLQQQQQQQNITSTTATLEPVVGGRLSGDDILGP